MAEDLLGGGPGEAAEHHQGDDEESLQHGQDLVLLRLTRPLLILISCGDGTK